MLTCPGNLVVICQNKYKVFFWLLIKDRFSTREYSHKKKKTWLYYDCELCSSSGKETLAHLSFNVVWQFLAGVNASSDTGSNNDL